MVFAALTCYAKGGQEVMSTSVTFSASLVAVRGFVEDDYEHAVGDAARRALSRWDERVSHHEVVAELG